MTFQETAAVVQNLHTIGQLSIGDKLTVGKPPFVIDRAGPLQGLARRLRREERYACITAVTRLISDAIALVDQKAAGRHAVLEHAQRVAEGLKNFEATYSKDENSRVRIAEIRLHFEQACSIQRTNERDLEVNTLSTPSCKTVTAPEHNQQGHYCATDGEEDEEEHESDAEGAWSRLFDSHKRFVRTSPNVLSPGMRLAKSHNVANARGLMVHSIEFDV